MFAFLHFIGFIVCIIRAPLRNGTFYGTFAREHIFSVALFTFHLEHPLSNIGVKF